MLRDVDIELRTRFNSTLVRFKLNIGTAYAVAKVTFQFHSGSIQTDTGVITQATAA